MQQVDAAELLFANVLKRKAEAVAVKVFSLYDLRVSKVLSVCLRQP
jgi:hypothetical protein